MTIPSRTPPGWSNSCPNCTASLRIEPSALFGDATCFQCGALLWFLHLEPRLRVYDYASSQLVRKRVIAFVAAQIKVDPEKVSETTFYVEGLGTDSLDTIELAMKLEKEIDSL